MKKTTAEICNGKGEEDQLRGSTRRADHQPDRPRSDPRSNRDLVESGAPVAHKHLADLLGRNEPRQRAIHLSQTRQHPG